ncbi:F-type H+-transporting ATPase subunit b [Desulfitispora alkaliphila]|uniref:F0F1 ATP synthase subunit B n=1 Tax=Desulfitispora alkaliphila TaxID=622674 RepID=UPI003D1EB198
MHFDFWTLLWTILNLFVVIVVLNKLLYKPMTEMMEKRENEIEESINKAATDRKEAEALLADYKSQIANAKSEAQKIIKEASEAAEKNKEQITAKATEEAERTLEKARREIRLEKEKALGEVRDEIATLAVLAAGKVVDKSISVEDHEKMVRQFVDQVGDVQ